MDIESALKKEKELKSKLETYGSLLIAYSGGVDSTYLADVAHEVLGERAVMVLIDAPSLPRAERNGAVKLAEERGWNLRVVPGPEFEDEQFLANDEMRCYYCKRVRFGAALKLLDEEGLAALAHGENAEDALDTTRVGIRAAKELDAVAPLEEVGLTKAEIRALSVRRNLPTAEKPSTACLATRIPNDVPISIPVLEQIERAEVAIASEGFTHYRARHHDNLCRIELDPDDIPKLTDPERRERLVKAIQDAGYRYVTVDLAGYRMGNTAT